MNILEKIIAHKQKEIEDLPQINKENLQPSCKNFLQALKNSDKKWTKLMAEIKPKSPSQGEIFPQADIVKIAGIYEQNGVAAISVLTDEYFFGGSWNNLKNISQKVKIPVLCKEFILTDNQIYTARQNGADAVLLMTQVLEEKKVANLLQVCRDLNMTGLVEIFDEEQLAVALRCGAKAILVNSRDFFDPNLKVDLNNFQKMLPKFRIISLKWQLLD